MGKCLWNCTFSNWSPNSRTADEVWSSETKFDCRISWLKLEVHEFSHSLRQRIMSTTGLKNVPQGYQWNFDFKPQISVMEMEYPSSVLYVKDVWTWELLSHQPLLAQHVYFGCLGGRHMSPWPIHVFEHCIRGDLFATGAIQPVSQIEREKKAYHRWKYLRQTTPNTF